MADANDSAAILAQVNEDLKNFGYITQETADRMKAAEQAAKDFATRVSLGSKAVTSLAEASVESAKAMHDGAKGNQAFNSSLDKMREGVEATGALLTSIIPGGPVVKAFIAAATMATGKLFDLQKTAGKMSDDLFKGFQGLSRSGAAASDGMTGLQAGMRKLGLGVQDMDDYVRLIGESGKDLALFKGSVFEGRKAFEDIGKGMQQYNYQLRAAGLTQEEINAGAMSYLRLQTRIGQAQTQTTQQLAEGAKKYLIEQDALTKLTGQSRQEAEQAMEAARSEQRFRAKLEQMRNSGDERQIAAANELEKANRLISSQSKEAGQGFRDLSTGMVTTEAAQKALISSNGAALEQATKIATSQQNAIDGTQEIGRAFGKFAKDTNMLAQAGVFEDIGIKFSEAVELGLFANRNLAEEYAKIQKDQAEQGEKGKAATDALLDANIRLAKAQQDAMLALQETTGKMMLGATETAILLAKEGEKMDEVYKELVPLMGQFNVLMGELVKNVLPVFIDVLKGALKILNPLIKGDAKEAAKVSGEIGAGKALGAGAGAIAGAEIGAAAGSVIMPVVGTAIGAVLGGLIGGAGGYGLGALADKAAMEGRAAGGPVNANTPYIVGEKGPELFLPKGAGEIISTKQLLGSSQPAGMPDVDVEYRKIVAAIKDITIDVNERRRLEDQFTKDVKNFTDHNRRYQDSMTSLLDQDLSNTKTYMEAGGTPGALGSAASSGQGLQPGGGMGMTAGGSLSGLKLKTGDVHEAGSALSPQLIQLAKSIQENMPNFNYFSAFNDRFHQEKASSSSHTRGTALDFTLKKPPTPEEGQEIVKYLRSMGASLVIDEYNNPSSNATAGHIHAQIPGFADGGVAMDPTIAMVAEKGPEAMIPLTNDGFLGKLSTVMSALVPQQQQMISLLDDIRRSQQATATASERLAAVASN